MVSRVTTVAFSGIDVQSVDVQVQLSSGQPAFIIVGLPDKAVAESKERIRAALHASGLSLPSKRIVINLAPADLPKEGSHYDLPIALGILVAIDALALDQLTSYVALGELSLDGTISSVSGVLLAAMHANSLDKGLICPDICGSEAAWASADLEILAGGSLIQLANHFKGTQVIGRPEPIIRKAKPNSLDLKDMKGQETAKRALEVAAAGGHNMLMIGPPGAGKSMLAERLPSILPPLTPAELLEVSMISSIAGKLEDGALSDSRPFRAPHHSASVASLVGGGAGMRAKPGELSLAHHGVLFLDEFPEFNPRALDSLRQPIETGKVVIARSNFHVTYPAFIQLIAAMNPCRCGRYGEFGVTCRRGIRCAAEYQERISAPLWDRIDIVVEVFAVSASDMTSTKRGDSSAEVMARVMHARNRQEKRLKESGIITPASTNAAMSPRQVEEIVQLDPDGRRLMETAVQKLQLSARGYHRVLKVARTLADLSQEDKVAREHLAEALGYRSVISHSLREQSG